MKYTDLQDQLKNFTIFSSSDVKKIDNTFYRPRLNEWQNKHYIKKVVNRYYIFNDLIINDHVLFEIANKIYNPSYISLEIALSYYHLIPESVYEVTSVSTRKTKRFKTPVGEFSYKSLRPYIFFGYKLVKYDQKSFKIAEPEKAILDYLYFNHQLKTPDDFKAIRIDLDSFHEHVSKDRLISYLSVYKQKTFKTRVTNFMRFIENA